MRRFVVCMMLGCSLAAGCKHPARKNSSGSGASNWAQPNYANASSSSSTPPPEGGAAKAPAPNGISGRIVGPDGQPISGVQVTTQPETDIAITKKDGRFAITEDPETHQAIKPGQYHLKLDKRGFKVTKEPPAGMLVDYKGGPAPLEDIEMQMIGGPPIGDLPGPSLDREQNNNGGDIVRHGQ